MAQFGDNQFFPRYPTSDRETKIDFLGIDTPEIDPRGPLRGPETILQSNQTSDEKRIELFENHLRAGGTAQQAKRILDVLEFAGELEPTNLEFPEPELNLEFDPASQEIPNYLQQFSAEAPPAPEQKLQPPPVPPQPPSQPRQNRPDLFPAPTTGQLAPTPAVIQPQPAPQLEGANQLQAMEAERIRLEELRNQQRTLPPAVRKEDEAFVKQENMRALQGAKEELQNLGIGLKNFPTATASAFGDLLVGASSRALYGSDTLSQLGIDTNLVSDALLLDIREEGESWKPQTFTNELAAIAKKIATQQEVTPEERQKYDEFTGDQLTPFQGKNFILGEFFQTLPSSAPALVQGLTVGAIASLAGPLAGKSGVVAGSLDAATSQNVGSAIAELKLLFNENVPLDPRRKAIRQKLRLRYPDDEALQNAMMRAESTLVREVSDNRMYPYRIVDTDKAPESAWTIELDDGKSAVINLASIADAASILTTRNAASFTEFASKNIGWDIFTEGITGFFDYKAVRDGMQIALKEVLGDDITNEEAHLWNDKEAIKAAAMEAAAGGTVSGLVTTGQYMLAGPAEMDQQFETVRQRRLGKKIAKSEEAKAAKEQSLRAWYDQKQERLQNQGDQEAFGRGEPSFFDALFGDGVRQEELQGAEGMLTGQAERTTTEPNLLDPSFDIESGVTQTEEGGILAGGQVEARQDRVPSGPIEVEPISAGQQKTFDELTNRNAEEIVATPQVLQFAIKLLAKSNKSLRDRVQAGKVKVVGTVEEAQKLFPKAQINSQAEGYFDKDTQTITFIAENIASGSLEPRPDFVSGLNITGFLSQGKEFKLSPVERMAIRAVEVIEHEYVGHQGLRDIMSDEDRDALLQRMYITFGEEIDAFRQERYPNANDLTATEEWIVNKYAEKGQLKAQWQADLRQKLAESRGDIAKASEIELRSLFAEIVKQQREGVTTRKSPRATKQPPPQTTPPPEAPAQEGDQIGTDALQQTPLQEEATRLFGRTEPEVTPAPQEDLTIPPLTSQETVLPERPQSAPRGGILALDDVDIDETADDSAILTEEAEPVPPPPPDLTTLPDAIEEEAAPEPAPVPVAEDTDIDVDPPEPIELSPELQSFFRRYMEAKQEGRENTEAGRLLRTMVESRLPSGRTVEELEAQEMPAATAPEVAEADTSPVPAPAQAEPPAVEPVEAEAPTARATKEMLRVEQEEAIKPWFASLPDATRELVGAAVKTPKGKVSEAGKRIAKAQTFEDLSARDQNRLLKEVFENDDFPFTVDLPERAAPTLPEAEQQAVPESSVDIESLERTPPPEIQPVAEEPTTTLEPLDAEATDAAVSEFQEQFDEPGEPLVAEEPAPQIITEPPSPEATMPPPPEVEAAPTIEPEPPPITPTPVQVDGGVEANIPRDIAAVSENAPAQVALVNVDDIFISNELDGSINPDFARAAGVQPRDRTSLQADPKLREIIGEPDETRFLGNSPDPGMGAPIINNQGAVLSGNNRSRALKYLAEQATNAENQRENQFWQNYEDELLERAEGLGFSPSTVLERINEAKANDTRLIMVRRFTEDLPQGTTEQIANIENKPQVEVLSLAEKARDLGNQMNSIDVQSLITEDGLAITRKGVRERIQALVPNASEYKLYFTEDGGLTKEGEKIFTLALFTKAYPKELVDQISLATEIPAQVGALRDSVPKRLNLLQAVDAMQLNQDLKQELQGLTDRIYQDWREAEAVYNDLEKNPAAAEDFSNIGELMPFKDKAQRILVRSMRGNTRKASITSMRKKFDKFYEHLKLYATDLVDESPLGYEKLVENFFSVDESVLEDPSQGALFSLRPTFDPSKIIDQPLVAGIKVTDPKTGERRNVDRPMFESKLVEVLQDLPPEPVREDFASESKFLKARGKHRQQYIYDGMPAGKAYDRLIEMARSKKVAMSRRPTQEVQTLFGDKETFVDGNPNRPIVVEEVIKNAAIPEILVHTSAESEYVQSQAPGGSNYRQIVLVHKNMEQNQPKYDYTIQGDHFPVENSLFFFLVQDRRTPDGEKVLFMDQLQSDRFQQGREFGFEPLGLEESRQLLEDQIQTETSIQLRHEKVFNDLSQVYQEYLDNRVVPRPSDQDIQNARENAKEELDRKLDRAKDPTLPNISQFQNSADLILDELVSYEFSSPYFQSAVMTRAAPYDAASAPNFIEGEREFILEQGRERIDANEFFQLNEDLKPLTDEEVLSYQRMNPWDVAKMQNVFRLRTIRTFFDNFVDSEDFVQHMMGDSGPKTLDQIKAANGNGAIVSQVTGSRLSRAILNEMARQDDAAPYDARAANLFAAADPEIRALLDKVDEIKNKRNNLGVPPNFLQENWWRRGLEFITKLAAREGYDGIVLSNGDQTMRYNQSPPEAEEGTRLFYDQRYPNHLGKIAKNYDAVASDVNVGINKTTVSETNIQSPEAVIEPEVNRGILFTNDDYRVIDKNRDELFSLRPRGRRPLNEEERQSLGRRFTNINFFENLFDPAKLIYRIKRIASGVSGFVDPFAYVKHRDELLTLRNLAKGKIQKAERVQREIYDGIRLAETPSQIYDMLTQGLPEESVTNESDRAIAVKARDEIDDLGQQLVELGQIPQKSYEKYRFKYLPQVYLKYLLPDEVNAVLSTGRKPSPLNYTKRRKLTGDNPTDLLVQEVLGIVKDPAFLAAQSIGTVGRDIALLEYFQSLAENPAWTLQDQFTGFSLHDEMQKIINEMLDANQMTQDEAIQLSQRLRLHELEPQIIPSNLLSVLDVFDDWITGTSAKLSQAVEDQKAIAAGQQSMTETDTGQPAQVEAALAEQKLWSYIRSQFTRLKTELERTDPDRPYLNQRRLRRRAKALEPIIVLAVDNQQPIQANSKQRAAADWLSNNLERAGLVEMLKVLDPIIGMRGYDVTASYLSEEAQRIRDQIAPTKSAKYQQALYTLTKRMDDYKREALDKMGLPVDESATAFEGWAKMPKDKRYGALRGMWVKQEIYDDIVGFTQIEPGKDNFMEKFLFGDDSVAAKYQRYQKLFSVALNPPSMARNFVSNKLWMYVITGMPPFPINPSNLGANALNYNIRAVQALLSNDANQRDRQYKEIFEKYGLGVGTFSNQELKRIRQEVAEFQIKLKTQKNKLSPAEKRELSEMTGLPIEEFKEFSAAEIYYLHLANLWNKYIVDKGGFIYQNMEFMDKMSVVMYAIEEKGLSEQEAVRLAEDALFDYSLVRPWVRSTRTSLLGAPFMTYTAKVLETYPRALKRDPAGVGRRSLFLLAWQYKLFNTLSKIIQFGFKQTIEEMFEEDEEDSVDALKKARGEWAEKNPSLALFPLKDSMDRFQLIDQTYYIPWGMFTRAAEEFSRGNIAKGVGEAGIMQGFVINLVAGYRTGVDPFTKQKFIDDYLPEEDQDVQRQIWLAQQLQPTILRGLIDEAYKYVSSDSDVPIPSTGGVIRQLIDALAAEGIIPTIYDESTLVDSEGQPKRTLGQSLGRAFAGANLYSVDPLNAQRRNIELQRYRLGRLQARRKNEAEKIAGNPNLSNAEKSRRIAERDRYYNEAIMKQYEKLLETARPLPETITD